MMEKIVGINFYSSLAFARLDILIIHNNAFENSVTLDSFFISEMNFYNQCCINYNMNKSLNFSRERLI